MVSFAGFGADFGGFDGFGRWFVLSGALYDIIDNISPFSTMPLIQLTLSGPSASIWGGHFV